MRKTRLIGLLVAILWPAAATAQDPGLVRRLPDDSVLSIQRDVVFRQVSDTTLRFDIYRPARHTAPLPVLIIYNGFAVSGLRTRAQQVGWSKLAAAAGLAAVGYDSHPRGEVADFDSLVAYLRVHATELRIDASRIAILAWSGHVTRGLGVAVDSRRDYLRAAAFLYGIGLVDSLRVDLPTLIVRAGLDNARLNRRLDSLIARSMAANAHLSVLAYGGGYHGFDGANDNDYTRSVIDQVLAFLAAFTGSTISGAIAQDLPVARAAAALYQENWRDAVSAYRELVNRTPGNVDLHLKLGEALLGAGNFDDALTSFARAWELSDRRRARDIAYPAAMAAARLGSFSRARPWLEILVVRTFTRAQLATDPNLRGLHADSGFQAFLRGN